MNRRTFLQSGAMTAALFCLRPVWAASADKKLFTDAEILARTDERIEKHRMGDGSVVVRDSKGKTVRSARVTVQQLRHDFLFGSNFFMFNRCGAPDLEEAYRTRFAALLNYCTLGFYWASYESRRGQPNHDYMDQVAAWTSEHGITCKGHPLAWDHPAGSPAWLPDDPKEVERLSVARVGEIVSRFRGHIDIWDVVNEATHLANKLNHTKMADWASAKGAVPYVAEHLAAARAENPKATLLVNDYRTDPPYFRLLEGLRTKRAFPFDVVGIQSHMHDGLWPLRKTWDICDTYSKLGRPLHFTETTLVSGPRKGSGENWGATTPEGEARQAELTEKFYRALFAHPAVQAITWWDFSDLGAWQGAASGWLRRDMSPKPVYERLMSLVKGAWWTKTEGQTNSHGELKLRAFFGEYRLEAELPDGRRVAKDVYWKRGEKNRFELRG